MCDWCTEGVLPEPNDDARRIRRRRRPATQGQLALRRPAECERTRPGRSEEPPLWAVTVTLGGDPVEPAEARAALERLSLERPFIVSARYDAARAEVRYWDECEDAAEATRLALRMWSDHERSAGLPAWRVIGLEVHDRETARKHWARTERAAVRVLGEIRPFDGE